MPAGDARTTILADVCEALVGAVFIDGGYKAADELIVLFWKERMLKPLRPLRDPKTMLQEWAQARGLPTPAYRELARTGPHHDPEFRVAVVLPDRPPAEGIGKFQTRRRTGRRSRHAHAGRRGGGQARWLSRTRRTTKRIAALSH